MVGLSIFHQLPAWQLTLQTYLHIICLDKYFYTLSSEIKYETVLYVRPQIPFAYFHTTHHIQFQMLKNVFHIRGTNRK